MNCVAALRNFEKMALKPLQNMAIGKGMSMTDLKSFGEGIVKNLERVIVGKAQSVELVVIGLLCQGHILIEDVPGVGKTMLARSLAKSLDCMFNRIQFTPDMLQVM
jgi:MoxR-like ATPase